MGESQGGGMQGLPRTYLETIGDELLVFRIYRALAYLASAIAGVVEYRIAETRHVHSDLVCAAGLQTALDKGDEAEALKHPVMRDGMLALLRVVGHHETQPVVRITDDIAVDRAFVVLDIAPDYSDIAAVYAVIVELLREFQLGLVVLGHSEQSAGVLVYPVHKYAHAFVVGVRALGYAQMMGQGVDERALEVSVAWMDDHPRRLVDHQHVVILVDYVKRYLLRQNLEAAPAVGHHETDHVTWTHYVIRLDRHIVYPHIAFLQRLLYVAARGVLQMRRHVFVDSHRSLSGVHFQPEVLEHLLSHISHSQAACFGRW